MNFPITNGDFPLLCGCSPEGSTFLKGQCELKAILPTSSLFFGGTWSHRGHIAGIIAHHKNKSHKERWTEDEHHRCPFPIEWLINRGVEDLPL